MQSQVVENRQGEEMEGLRFLWLELTAKCQLQCVHCYVSSSPNLPLYGSMKVEDWEKKLGEGFDLGCRAVQFIGGEATIYPELGHLIEYASGLGYTFIEVFTNGVSFGPQLKQTFVRHGVHLAFSFYSQDPAVHDTVTKLPGSQAKTLSNILWTRDSNLPLRVGVVEMPMNVQDVGATIQFLKELGIREVAVSRTFGVGRGQELVEGQGLHDRLCGSCWRGSLCVTSSGDVFPCIMARDEAFGQNGEDLKVVIESTLLLAFRRRIHEEFVPQALCMPDILGDCTPWKCMPKMCNPETHPPPRPL